ncbi:MAG: hypothetical protein HZY76_16305 [Anaerolineae bacterium]|nr:MAG: hypothetical protein HZY76_16305 [Anaerolineae bacterium]
MGKVLVGEVGIYTGRNPDTVRGADVIFISHARLAQVKSASFLDVAPARRGSALTGRSLDGSAA